MKYDCHVEVFDPVRWRPAKENMSRGCATAGDLQAFLYTRRTQHAVVVQALDYSGAHGCLLDAVRTMGVNTRAVGTLSSYANSTEIEALSQLGMRGTRVVMQNLNFLKALEDIEHLHAALPPQWHIELTGSWSWLAGLGPPLARLQRIFVAVCPGMWQQPFALSDTSRFLWWLEMGNVYLKLLSREHLNCQRALCLAQPLLASALCGAADRLLWGSGWPYPSARPLPASASLQSDGRLSWSANALDFNARAVYGFND